MQLGTLRQVGQPVVDFDRAVAFYRDVLGLQMIAQPGPLAFFDLGGVRLLMEEPGDGAPVPGPDGGVLYFVVVDIEAAQRQLAARGVQFLGEPHLIHRDDTGTFGPAGQEEWMSFFTDSEGNTLALSERRDPAAASSSG